MRYALYNNAGEFIEYYMRRWQAERAARIRTEQLCGARHYVKDSQTDEIIFDTGAK